MNTEKLRELDKKYLWHPFTQMREWMEDDFVIIERGKGNYLIDTDGKKYLDCYSSLWVNVHGHGHPHVTKAIKEQVDKICHSTMLGAANVPAILLAEKLVEITPQGLNKVFYSDSGSTSVEIALKMAYQYWQQCESPKPQKRKYITFRNAYHGDTIGSVSVGGTDLFHSKYRDLLFEVIHHDYPNLFSSGFKGTEQEYLNECLSNIEKTMQEKNEQIAALVVEPLVQGASGMLSAPPGFLKALRELCTKYEILMIVDEVATGFGKTGKMFACEHENITPDLMCIAKGITAGYLPLSATLATDKVYKAFLGEYKEKKTFFHGHSYTGNQVACAAALASLEVFKEENVLENLQEKIKHLSVELNTLKGLKHVADIRRVGIMTGVELMKDPTNKTEYNWEDQVGIKVCKELIQKGFMIRPLGNVIVIMPPLSISLDEISSLIHNLRESIISVTSK